MIKDAAPPRIARLASEFVVIVVGVLVALAADSWIQSAEDRGRARAGLALLVEDLVMDSTRIEEIMPYPPRHDSIRAVLWSTPGDAAISEDSVLVLFSRILPMPDFLPSRSTYESLVATDGIRYLGDAQLRADLIRYYEERQADVLHWHGWYIQEWVAMTDMMRESQTPAPADFEEGMRPWDAVPQRLTTSWREIRQNDAFMSQLWNVAIVEQILRSNIEDGLNANRELLSRVRVLAMR